MSDSDREKFLAHISKLCDEYGPWAVLWVTTQALRPAFKAIEPQRPRHPRNADKESDGTQAT